MSHGTVQFTMRLPRDRDGLWEAVTHLDRSGFWTIAEAAKRAGVHPRTMNEFVSGLVAAGIARTGGHRASRGPASTLYRLTRMPQQAPNLTRAGEPLPETVTEVLWRTMKIAKVFSAAELAELAHTAARPIGLATTQTYLRDLEQAGIVIRSVTGKGSGAVERFRLILNLGARPPQILTARIVFDPNAKAVVGKPLAREVRP